MDEARERLAFELFRDWSTQDFDDLARFLRMLADGMNRDLSSAKEQSRPDQDS